MATTAPEIKQHQVVSHTEWVEARKAFLAREKEFTHLRDELSRQRRELPWEKVSKPYKFAGPARHQFPRRSLRKAQPACRLPLHARPRLDRGLPQLLVSLQTILTAWPSISPIAM